MKKIEVTKKSTYRILTYNLFMRPPPIKTNEDDYKNQRLYDIIDDVIKNYDIVCFQELFQTANFRAQKMIHAAIKRGFNYWKMSQPPKFWQGPPVDSGLLVISRFPIVYSKFQSYKIGILSDSASDKAYIYCKINIKGDILHLFNTHLQASYISDDPAIFSYTVLTRLSQIKYLRQCMLSILEQQNYQKEDLVMLVGDLNIDSRRAQKSVHDIKLLNRFMPKSGQKKEHHFVGIIEKQILDDENKQKDWKQSSNYQIGMVLNKNSQQDRSTKFKIDMVEQQDVNRHEENVHSQFLHRQYFLVRKIFEQRNIHLKDLILEKDEVRDSSIENHPSTFGQDDTVLTGASQVNSFQRLDYIFQVNPYQNQGKLQSTLKPIQKSCVVNKMKVKSRPYTQLSDHFAVQVLLTK